MDKDKIIYESVRKIEKAFRHYEHGETGRLAESLDKMNELEKELFWEEVASCRVMTLYCPREPLFEMSRVGFLSNQGYEKSKAEYVVIVWSDDPGHIPHAHIKNNSGTFESCVRLDEPKYFNHQPHMRKMPRALILAFDSFMRATRVPLFQNNYVYACSLWNDNNSEQEINLNFDSEGKVIVPDYSLLEAE